MGTPKLSEGVSFSQGNKIIRDYILHFTRINIELPELRQFVFPRIGYLVFNLITGDGYHCNFLNYNQSESIPNHSYITGLFSDGSLTTSQVGTGGGYGIKIHPVIGYYMLRIPLYNITDKQVRFSEVLERRGKHLRTIEVNERIDSLDNIHLQKLFFESLPPKSNFLNDVIFHAVNKIISSKGLIRIAKLARDCYMSERTLYRQFKIKVGLSPQAYAKIIRISCAMDLLMEQPGASLDQIAFDSGYYDAAHLSRDFRDHVFLKPSEFHHDLHPMTSSFLAFQEFMKNV